MQEDARANERVEDQLPAGSADSIPLLTRWQRSERLAARHNATQSIECRFYNFGHRSVDVVWHNVVGPGANGKMCRYAVLISHGVTRVQSYPGHVWRFYDHEDGELHIVMYPSRDRRFVVPTSGSTCHVLVMQDGAAISLTNICFRFLWHQRVGNDVGTMTQRALEAVLYYESLPLPIRLEFSRYIVRSLRYRCRFNAAVHEIAVHFTNHFIARYALTADDINELNADDWTT